MRSLISFLLLLHSSTSYPVSNDGSLNGDPTDRPPYSRDESVNEAMLIAFFIFLGFFIIFIVSSVVFCVVRRRLRLTEDEILREEENQAYLELNSDEQELYFQSKDYLQNNPYYRGELTLSQNLSIQEKGIGAFEFQKDVMLTNNDLMIINKTELNFFKNFECSTVSNLPVPMKNEVYYFESKIYSLPDPENTTISVGLSVKPYPWFRLPGRHLHSISYDSDGYRRFNQPFKLTNEPPFPKFVEGDVIGVGYRVRSGTVFFTRNGKKVSESKIGGHIRNFKIAQQGQIFPIIGANNLCSVHVNLGQMGFVFIEGNVKSWGYAPLEGTGPAPPAYNKFNADILLERSEVDDDNDLSEREDDFPPDFWEVHGRESDIEGANDSGVIDQDKFSYNAYSDVNSNDERITLDSLVPPNRPPSYSSDEGGEFAVEADSSIEEGDTIFEDPLNEMDIQEAADRSSNISIDAVLEEGRGSDVAVQNVLEELENSDVTNEINNTNGNRESNVDEVERAEGTEDSH
ncbi:uncharacterized protein RJT20DRAFT_53399 [Scheffersomyces xylosifermentans]|uniref:uncharacterized protein n=1 Tax=Scheffersomyces xylosifermentans TaxID=1304137 RepID=UPI00315C50CE